MVSEHNWVKHVVTPIFVLQDTDGEPVAFVDPEAQILAEDAAAYGCDRCGEPMVTHHNQPCAGEPLCSICLQQGCTGGCI